MAEKYRFDLLTDTRICYRYLQSGLAVIVLTFLAGILVFYVSDLISVYDVLVMPALFIGLGLLLFGVGTHLFVMYLNVVRMIEGDGEQH